jgi:hypothetical protein
VDGEAGFDCRHNSGFASKEVCYKPYRGYIAQALSLRLEKQPGAPGFVIHELRAAYLPGSVTKPSW